MNKTTIPIENSHEEKEYEANMVEINPLVVTEDNRILALDAKMTFDDNALFRHPYISELRDKSQEDPRESRAADRGLSYVGLEGNIGCIVWKRFIDVGHRHVVKFVDVVFWKYFLELFYGSCIWECHYWLG